MLNLTHRQACQLWNGFRSANNDLLEFIFDRYVAPFAHSEVPFKGGSDEKLIVAFLRHLADVIERGILQLEQKNHPSGECPHLHRQEDGTCSFCDALVEQPTGRKKQQ